MDYSRVKHLELLQPIIARLASNSFALKGWSVAITAALLGLSAKGANVGFAIIAFYPALAFWGLDAYYLRQERRFRALYNAIRTDKDVEPFTMDPNGFDGDVDSWARTLKTTAIVGLHAPIVTAIVAVLIYAVRN